MNEYNLSLDDISGEVWKPIKGYKGLYEVSNFGRIKSLERKSWNGYKWIRQPEKIRLCKPNYFGYPQFTIWKDNKQKTERVHKVVARTFIDNPSNYKVVNHIDGDKTNNRVDNLEWCTHSHNSLHAYHVLKNVCLPEQKDGNHWKSYTVQNVTTGEIFETMKAAFESVKGCKARMSYAIKNNTPYHNCYWKRIDNKDI